MNLSLNEAWVKDLNLKWEMVQGWAYCSSFDHDSKNHIFAKMNLIDGEIVPLKSMEYSTRVLTLGAAW